MTEWAGVRIRRGVVGDAEAPEDLAEHLAATYGVAHQARVMARILP